MSSPHILLLLPSVGQEAMISSKTSEAKSSYGLQTLKAGWCDPAGFPVWHQQYCLLEPFSSSVNRVLCSKGLPHRKCRHSRNPQESHSLGSFLKNLLPPSLILTKLT